MTFRLSAKTLFWTSRTHISHTFQVFRKKRVGFSFQSDSTFCRYDIQGHYFQNLITKLGTLMKSITDVWFILDIQPFFALCDKNYSKIQNEGGEGVER